MRRVKSIAVPVLLTLLFSACGQSDPKKLLLGEWKLHISREAGEKLRSENPGVRGLKPSRGFTRTIHFFPDGSGVRTDVYDDDPANQASQESFAWSISEDGKTLKTEDREASGTARLMGLTVLVAHIETLTQTDLYVRDLSHALGRYSRVVKR